MTEAQPTAGRIVSTRQVTIRATEGFEGFVTSISRIGKIYLPILAHFDQWLSCGIWLPLARREGGPYGWLRPSKRPAVFDAYSVPEIIFILAVYFFAASAKGVTGLGFSTTCLAPMALVLGLKETLPLLIIPSVSSNIMVMVGAGRFRETTSRFWPMFLATVPGLLLGLWLLAEVDGALMGAVLGVVLVIYVAFAYANPEMRLRTGLEKPLQPISGFLTGLVNGTTGSQVMPSMPFLMSLHLDRNMFIQAINCSFTLSA